MKTVIGLLTLLLTSQCLAATCKISEYRDLILDANGRIVPVAQEPALATQSVTYTTSSASAAFNDETRYVRIVCDAKAHFIFTRDGTNATASSPYLSADVSEYFGIQRAPRATTQTLKVEFYDGSS
jgi:hypothetical protein